jgi:hypothetical protein
MTDLSTKIKAQAEPGVEHRCTAGVVHTITHERDDN